jgi:hypothetical protein
MKILIFICLILLQFLVQAQKKENFLGILFSIDQKNVQYSNSEIIYRTGFKSGIIFTHHIQPKMNLETGLFLDPFNMSGKLFYGETDPLILAPNSIYSSEFKGYFLAIPLKLNYLFLVDKKLNPFVSAGASFSPVAFYKSITQNTFENGTFNTNKSSGLEWGFFFPEISIGAGLQLTASEKIKILVRPNYHYYIFPETPELINRKTYKPHHFSCDLMLNFKI